MSICSSWTVTFTETHGPHTASSPPTSSLSVLLYTSCLPQGVCNGKALGEQRLVTQGLRDLSHVLVTTWRLQGSVQSLHASRPQEQAAQTLSITIAVITSYSWAEFSEMPALISCSTGPPASPWVKPAACQAIW